MSSPMKIIPFEPFHIKAMQLRQYDSELLPLFGDLDLVGRQFAASSIAFTGIKDGVIIGSAGVTKYWPGVGEGWLISSIHLDSNKKSAVKAVKHFTNVIVEAAEIRRLQVTVRKDYTIAKRWVKFLGFKPEGLMKAYGADGSDHYRYARIFE